MIVRLPELKLHCKPTPSEISNDGRRMEHNIRYAKLSHSPSQQDRMFDNSPKRKSKMSQKKYMRVIFIQTYTSVTKGLHDEWIFVET